VTFTQLIILGSKRKKRAQKWCQSPEPVSSHFDGFNKTKKYQIEASDVMIGLRMYSFTNVMIDCLNYVRSVSLSGAAFNPSWHLTAVGAGRSVVAVHAASRRWLLFSLGERR
jgi:hypothetical protein